MQNITYGESDTKPPQYYYSNGLIQVLCNVKQVEVIRDIDKIPKLIWKYDYVDIDGQVTKEKIISALNKYSITTEDVINDIIIKDIKI